MPYTVRMYVDGGCRRNGYHGATGAAPCVWQGRYGRQTTWTKRLPSSSTPTSQRAELTAVILALEQGLEIYCGLRSNPYMDVKIFSDSQYAVNCMTKWRAKWTSNGFCNAKGSLVVNRDLMRQAYDLEEELAEEGDLEFVWIPREQNVVADAEVNQELDEMEEEG